MQKELDVANEKITLAESALATKCSVQWDERNQETLAELEKCKEIKVENDMCKTEKKTLTEMVEFWGVEICGIDIKKNWRSKNATKQAISTTIFLSCFCFRMEKVSLPR